MKKFVSLALVLCVCSVLLTGCGSIAREYWQDTTQLYKDNVYPEPSVDLSMDDVEPGQQQLARLMAQADIPLESLSRFLKTQEEFPDDRWVNFVAENYPWLNGILVVDTEGNKLLTHTMVPLKRPNLDPLKDIEMTIRDRSKIVSYIDQTPLGPEVYLTKPFYKDNAWMGMILVHFDAANLYAGVDKSDKLLVFTPDMVLWSGDYSAPLPLSDMNWKEILEDEVNGVEVVGDEAFHWSARTLGDKWLVYATGVDAAASGSSSSSSFFNIF